LDIACERDRKEKESREKGRKRMEELLCTAPKQRPWVSKATLERLARVWKIDLTKCKET
jgi:hypothetical protein